MLALSIRQPFAELILRGLKTVEYRTRPTRIIGQRFYIYAAKGNAAQSPQDEATRRIWSRDLGMPLDPPPRWMLELAERLILDKRLPRGLIVGSAVIEKVTRKNGRFEWHLTDVERIPTPRKPDRHPQPVWFRPFADTSDGPSL